MTEIKRSMSETRRYVDGRRCVDGRGNSICHTSCTRLSSWRRPVRLLSIQGVLELRARTTDSRLGDGLPSRGGTVERAEPTGVRSHMDWDQEVLTQFLYIDPPRCETSWSAATRGDPTSSSIQMDRRRASAASPAMPSRSSKSAAATASSFRWIAFSALRSEFFSKAGSRGSPRSSCPQPETATSPPCVATAS